MQIKSILAATALALPAVSAHGYVQWGMFGSTNETGWNFNVDPYLSPTPQRSFRKIPGNGPVTDVTLIDLQCNGYSAGGVVGTTPAALSATVAAGSTVSLQWTTWPASHRGPILTYMAKCPGSCTTYSPTANDKIWFKIAHAGKNSDGTWATDPLTDTPTPVTSFTIPASLPAGNYIIRHELVALHAAYTYPGAQFYPSCSQVTVTGSGSKAPSSSYLVPFPGAYTATTPGIVYDIYTNTSAYPIPGPAVWTG